MKKGTIALIGLGAAAVVGGLVSVVLGKKKPVEMTDDVESNDTETFDAEIIDSDDVTE